MYNQRRYGGSSGAKPSTPARGSADSRQSKSAGNRTKGGTNGGPSRVHSSTPQSKTQEQIKKELPVKKEPQTSKVEQINSTPKRNEGHQFNEDTYIEADVIGFDSSVDQSTEENPPEVKQFNKQETQREPDRNRSVHKIESTDSNEKYGSQKLRGDIRKQPPNNRAATQINNESQKAEKKDEIVEDGFGLVRIGGKRFVNIDSLILPHEKKHGGRSRLFIANLLMGVDEHDLKELFGRFGDPSEIFVNKDKGFGFVRLDYKVNAEIARNALDGYIYKGRALKVKFAAHQSAIEIHGIDRFTSNESLEAAFSQFGTVERATVVCDERGRSKGYAIIEFAFKKSAQTALHRINEGLFVLGRLPKPVTAKPLSQTDDEGIHEKDLERVPGLGKDREYKARFLQSSTPEYTMARKWKELEEEGQSQKERLEKTLEEEQQKLEYDFEATMHDQEAEYFRQELLQKQAAIEEEIRRYDEMRSRESMMMRQQGKSFENRRSDRRQSDPQDSHSQGMPNVNPNVGLGNLNQAAALAIAANSNILQAMKNQDGMGGNNQGMQRMPGPRGGPLGGPPRGHGMAGFGGMPPPRPLFEGRQNSQHGNSMAGTRRSASRENFHNSKRPRN